jgi:hypothetical protein
MFNSDVSKMVNKNAMQKAVQYLNKTINRSTHWTPTEMNKYTQLAEKWIRRIISQKKIQVERGFFYDKVGIVWLICFNLD